MQKHPGLNPKTDSLSIGQIKGMAKNLGKNTAFKAGMAGSIGGAALTLGGLGVAYAAHKKNDSNNR